MSEIQLDKVNLDDYKQIGEGGNGKTYVNPAVPGEILKVNNARISTWEAVSPPSTSFSAPSSRNPTLSRSFFSAPMYVN